MSKGSKQRVEKAFKHEEPDRTPLFEIFQPYHPIYWDIAGRNAATDQAKQWDALAEGISREEIFEESIQSYFKVCKFFELDIVRKPLGVPDPLPRPKKTGEKTWKLNGVDYVLNEKTKMIQLANPAEADSYSNKVSEDDLRKEIEDWDGTVNVSPGPSEELTRFKELADAEGIEWEYMAELGGGTGVAFWPPFQLMWLISDPDLVKGWMKMKMARALAITENLIREGCGIVAMGGDTSSDKGPILSPAHYHEFVLPMIQKHVNCIHENGAKAVYTSDGNHWAIKDDFFFNSGIDGYKEVDKAAGMTWDKLIEEKIDKQVCIIGNIDARYTLCLASLEEARKETITCLKYGQHSPGGHILHASHSVHEDVQKENYYAVVNTYREFFGMDPLPEPR